MKISKTSASLIYALFVAVIYYFLSLLFYEYHTSGDLLIYRGFYEELNGVPIWDVPFLQFNYTNSSEPLYGILMWIGANFEIDHDLYLSFFNAILVFLLVIWMAKEKVGIVAQVLILANYYLFVLLTGAERLKFSYLLIFMSLVVASSFLRRFFAIGALFAHFQTLLLYIGHFAPNVVSFWWRQSVSRRVLGLLFFVIFLSCFWLLFSDALLGKYLAYERDEFKFLDILNLLALVLLVLYVTRDKVQNFISLFIFVLFGAALGPERVNMIAVSLCVFMIVKDGRTKNLAFLGLLAYFAFKSVGFFQNVVNYGNGFAS